jgi:hypothetical protein
LDKINQSNILSTLKDVPKQIMEHGIDLVAENRSDKLLDEVDNSPRKIIKRSTAFELFSFFTADIIKKNVLFTR